MIQTPIDKALAEKIRNCSAGEIVAMANIINAYRFARNVSAEEIARATFGAALFDDGWVHEVRKPGSR